MSVRFTQCRPGASAKSATDLAGESVHTGRGLIAAGAETPVARLIKLVEPHLAAL